MTTLIYNTLCPIKSCNFRFAEIQVGDKVHLKLDTVKVPTFPEEVIGTIVSITQGTASVNGWVRSYGIEYDETELGGAVVFLEACDLLEKPTCVSCCEELGWRIDALQLTTNTSPTGFGNGTNGDPLRLLYCIDVAVPNGVSELDLSTTEASAFNEVCSVTMIVPDTEPYINASFSSTANVIRFDATTLTSNYSLRILGRN